MFKLLYTIGAHVGATLLSDIASAVTQYQIVSGSGMAVAVTLVDIDGGVLARYRTDDAPEKLPKVPKKNLIDLTITVPISKTSTQPTT